jgi:hypothetical protein
MTDLRPFEPKRASPLTGGARFIRGFTRIGSVVAVLVALVGVPLTIMGAFNNYNYAVENHKSAQCIARLARNGYTFKKKYEYSSTLDYDVGGCSASYSLSYKPVTDVIAIADAPTPTFLTSDGASMLGNGLIITGLVAVAAYLGFWVVGWLCAGFTKDE